MPSLALQVAYDGTDFVGSQRQLVGRTVQGELEAALERLTGETRQEIRLKAAGRTDAGVHATGQVVAFRTGRQWPASKWVYALNSVLPPDVVVRAAREVDPSFEPRRCATGRSYRYDVLVSPVPDPLRRMTAFRVPALPREADMVACWSGIVGTHDFAAFRSTGSKDRDTRITVTEARVERQGDVLSFNVSAISFLYHMVRRLVGTVVSIGRGHLPAADFTRYFAEKGAGLRPSKPAPAHGLILTDVSFPPPWGWES